jgi:triacylglycerol lipase
VTVTWPAALGRVRALGVLVVAAAAWGLLLTPSAAGASGPRLTISRAELRAAFECPIDPRDARRTPIMLVTGTGATGEQAYLIGRDAFERYGHPVCYVNFPDFTTADIQVSVQYLVYGLRREFRMAGRKVAVFGISQGGLLPRFALTYWPDLRRKVSDVLSAAGTHHGTTVSRGCSEASPCAPANWQQLRGSNLLDALNSQPDETPGPVSYTTVRSRTDETVQPQGGRHPTSALDGARNILIQRVCPGRRTSHIGTAVDSVSFAAFVDAIADRGKGKRGAAKVSRFPADVCDHPYADGLDEQQTSAFLDGSAGLVSGQQAQAPKVASEPKVRKVFERGRR